MAVSLLCFFLLLVAVPAVAQEAPSAFEASSDVEAPVDPEAPVLDAQTGRVLSRSEIVVAAGDLNDAWLELTPLTSEGEALRIRFADRRIADGELRIPAVVEGAALLCVGALGRAVLCEEVYADLQAWSLPGELNELELRFEPGLAVEGRYLLDARAVEGARVAVVLAGLERSRGLTLPLGYRDEGDDVMQREVESDEDGRFRLPPLAEGEYFLETILPSGRVHRSEVFELPAAAAARIQAGLTQEAASLDIEDGFVADSFPASEVVWQLGDIELTGGLAIEVTIVDPQGAPLAGARVGARQGTSPATLVSYEATADAAGKANLSGFSVEHAVDVACHLEGYRSQRFHFELLPVQVGCELEPLAELSGSVLAVEGEVPPGVMITLEPRNDSAADSPTVDEPTHPRRAVPSEEGLFSMADVAAGAYVLNVAAPGYEVAQRDVDLVPGQELALETMVLLRGREVRGHVVDAESDEPIAGVEIRSLAPPGAVYTTSDSEGAFVLTASGRRDLILELVAEHHAAAPLTVRRQELVEREPLTLKMERAGWIRATIWDEALDLPCQGCRLLVQPTGESLTTDGWGVTRSRPLVPGSYRVLRPRTTHLGSLVIEQQDAESRRVTVRRGKVSNVRFGQQRHTVRIVFQPFLDSAWTLSARTERSQEKYRQHGPGIFHVRIPDDEELDLFLHFWDEAAAAEVEVQQITLPAGFSEDEITLSLTGAALNGRATSAGNPIVGGLVRLRDVETDVWAYARTRPDGSFEIPQIPAGVYSVVVGGRSITYVSLRAGQALDIGTVDLIPGGF